jgi:hypothetical protein
VGWLEMFFAFEKIENIKEQQNACC